MMDQAGVRSDRPEGERSRYAYAPCQFRSEAAELTPDTVLNRFRPRPTMCRPSSRCRTLPESVPATAWPCQGNSWSNDRDPEANTSSLAFLPSGSAVTRMIRAPWYLCRFQEPCSAMKMLFLYSAGIDRRCRTSC